MANNKKISNPLTLISIFAGIAEIAGSIVLVQLPEKMQAIFVWFVMGFPLLLVILFFATLIKKPKVLYGPEDFSNDESFLRLHQTVGLVGTDMGEISTQLQEITSLVSNLNPTDENNKKSIESRLHEVTSEVNLSTQILNSLKSFSSEEIPIVRIFPKSVGEEIYQNLFASLYSYLLEHEKAPLSPLVAELREKSGLENDKILSILYTLRSRNILTKVNDEWKLTEHGKSSADSYLKIFSYSLQ